MCIHVQIELSKVVVQEKMCNNMTLSLRRPYISVTCRGPGHLSENIVIYIQVPLSIWEEEPKKRRKECDFVISDFILNVSEAAKLRKCILKVYKHMCKCVAVQSNKIVAVPQNGI